MIVTENPEEEPPPDLADKNKADEEQMKKSAAESVEDALSHFPWTFFCAMSRQHKQYFA